MSAGRTRRRPRARARTVPTADSSWPPARHQGVGQNDDCERANEDRDGHALETDAFESEAVACPLAPGSATFHDGGTLHYSRGNSTSSRRRALVTNFRPAAMIAWERERGYNHRNELDELGVESEHVIARQG